MRGYSPRASFPRAGLYEEDTGTTHSLTANDVEVSTEVGSPALSQVHALSANGIEAASEVSAPALSQAHALSGDDVEATTEVGSPALGQGHALTGDDIEAASEVGSPSLTQSHALIADDVESASELSTPALSVSGSHALVADDIEVATELSVPELTVIGGAQPVQRGGGYPWGASSGASRQFFYDKQIAELARRIPKKGTRKAKAKRAKEVVQDFRLEFPEIDLSHVDRAIDRLEEQQISHRDFAFEIAEAVAQLEERQRIRRRRRAAAVALLAA